MKNTKCLKAWFERHPHEQIVQRGLSSTARLYLNLLPESPKNWGQVNQNLNDNNSDPMEISGTSWVLDITDWWQQQEEPHSEYANLSNMACDIFSIIQHGVRVEASFPIGRDIVGWRQSKTTCENLQENVVVRQFGLPNDGILADDYSGMDTTDNENDLELKKEVEESMLHRMANFHNLLGIWQGSQNLRATQKESCAQNQQLTAVGYISDTEEIMKASRSNFQHDCAATFELSERSTLLPAVSVHDLPGRWTQVLNVRWIKWIDCHLADSDEDSAQESISDGKNWLDSNGGSDNPTASDDSWEADDESDVELENRIEAPQSAVHRDVSCSPNVPGLIQPTRRSME